MQRFFSENTRQVLFTAVPLILFGIISVHLLLTVQDQLFSRLGSLIVAWALINLATKREKYLNYLMHLERNRFSAILNRDREMRRLMQKSIETTFDVHATQIAQICYKLQLQNPFVEDTENAIREFCERVDSYVKNATWTAESEALISIELEDENFYHRELRRFSGWGTLVWRLEVLLILWGTVQWGYGDLFVMWLEDLGWLENPAA